VPIPRDTRIYVAGHTGLVGSAILRLLAREGFSNILTATRDRLDLRDQAAVNYWFKAHRPELVFLAAGTAGGILANATYPADFIHDNLIIAGSIVHAAHVHGTKKLVHVASSSVYPRDLTRPIAERDLLAGPLEPTFEYYAVAQLAALNLCASYRKQHGSDFISAVATNVYGPHDNFELVTAPVVPSLIRRFHESHREGKPVVVWGTGKPRRELLHADDLASALLFLAERYEGPGHVNVGTGEDVTTAELADLVRQVVWPEAKISFDATKPDGTMRRLLDVSKVHALGWRHSIGLREGLERAYRWFLESSPESRPPHDALASF